MQLPSDIIVRCIFNQFCGYRDIIACSHTCSDLNAMARLSSPKLLFAAYMARTSLSRDDPLVLDRVQRNIVIRRPKAWRRSFPHAREAIIDLPAVDSEDDAANEWNESAVIQLLIGVHTLFILPYARRVQPLPVHAFVHLQGLHTFVVPRSPFIHDDTLSHLSGSIHTLNIQECTDLKPASFVHLRGIHTLIATETAISGAMVHLAGIHTLDITHCYDLDCSKFIHLRGIHTLIARGTAINDEAVSHLAGIHTLDVRSSRLVTGKSFVQLRGIHTLTVGYVNRSLPSPLNSDRRFATCSAFDAVRCRFSMTFRRAA